MFVPTDGLGLSQKRSNGYQLPEMADANSLDQTARMVSRPDVLSGGLGLARSVPPLTAAPPADDAAPAATAPVAPAMDAPPAQAAPPTPPPASANKPLIDFHTNPLGAIGLVLSNVAAGMQGRELPSDQLQKMELEKQAQAYKTAELGLSVVEKYVPILAQTPKEQQPAVMAHMQQIFGPALGGVNLVPMMTALSQASATQQQAVLSGIKELNVSPQQMAVFSAHPDLALKFFTDYADTKAKQAAEPPKSRTVQIGTDTVTQEYDPKTKAWTDVATGPKFEPKAPEHRQITRGTQLVEQDYNPDTKTWEDTPNASGDKFKPDNPQENNLAPVQIGYTGPDGEEIQTAASWNRKTGQYTDASTQKPINNPQNLRVIGNATGGARSQAAVARVLTNAEDATSGIENLSAINSQASGGLFKNLATTPLSALSRAVTPQDVQDMQATMAGLGRAMGGLATGGLAVDESVQKSYEGLNLNAGDSYLTKMRKLAEMRQQSTNALDVQSVSPILTNDQKKKAKELSDRIKTAIPWTVKDVQALENSNNPQVSLRDLGIGKTGVGAPPPDIAPLLDKYGPKKKP